MATNPQIPYKRGNAGDDKRPQLVAGTGKPNRPSNAVPGVLLAIVVAAALLAVIGYYLPRAPKKTQPPSAHQLQFSSLQMTPAPTGGAMTLRGQVMNTGERAVIGAQVVLSFHDAQGRILRTIAAPMVGMAAQGKSLVTDEFSKVPLKPNDTRPFEVEVSQIPAGWNHTMPEMKVVTVSAEGNR